MLIEVIVYMVLLCFFRYLFEPDHNQYLPTISLQHGPIDLGLMWPEAAMGVPQYSEVSDNSKRAQTTQTFFLQTW